MRISLPKLLAWTLPGGTVASSRRSTKLFAAILWSILCLGFSPGLRTAEDEIQTLTELPPLIYEWYPYEPVTLATNDELVMFGDVDDFGEGVYTCVWQSDRG